MARFLRPIPPTGLSIPAANILMGEVGGRVFDDVGDVEAFSLSLEVEEVERFGKNFAIKTLRKSDVIQVNATISMEVKDMTKFMRALSVASNTDSKLVQSAATGLSFDEAAMPGKVYNLGKQRVSNVSVVDALDPSIEYVEGLHFIVLEESGYVQLLSKPALAGVNATFSFDCAAITASDDMLKSGVGSNFNIRKTLNVIGINRIGPRDMLVLHDVQLRPDGERAFVGEDDYASLTLTGRVFADGSQPEGLELGYLVTLD